MQKISELIAQLQSYQDQYGDVMVTARTQSKVFELAMVDRASVMKPFAVVRLAEITPGTQAWRDYCAISNGDFTTKSPAQQKLDDAQIQRLTIEISAREAEIANEQDSVRRSFMQMAIDEARQELAALEADQ